MSLGGREFVSFYVLREKVWLRQINNILFLRHQQIVRIPLLLGLGNVIGMCVMQMRHHIFQLFISLVKVKEKLFSMFLMKILNHRTLKAPVMKWRNMMVINLFSTLIVMKIIKMYVEVETMINV
jgi:hypothetical protein